MGQIAENIDLWEVYKDRNESSPINESQIGSSSGIKLKKGPWTAEEDDILVDYVMKYGEGNWNNVQKNTGLLRSGKSCRLRWMNQLRPDLKKGAFSKEEENLIIDLHSMMGNKWALISEHLPGRTDNEIKNFWNTRIKRHKRAGLPLYPPRLHCRELPRTPQAHERCAPSTGGKRHHSTVPAINCNMPGAMHSGLNFNEEHSPQHLNMSATGTLTGDPGGFHHISLHLPTNSPHKSLQESPEWFLDAELSPANPAQNFDKASCPANLTPMHYSPASKIKLKTTYLELPSIQTLEVHLGFGDYYHLACSSLESYDAFPNSSSPVENIPPQIPSENPVLESFLPDTNTSSASVGLSPVASSTSSTATPSYMQANSGFNLAEMEPKNPISPILSFSPPMLSSFPDYLPSSSTTGTLKVEQSADYILPAGHNEPFEEAALAEADMDELSDWLNLSSSPGESLNLEYDCQDPISTTVGNVPGHEPASDARNTMPSICQMPELG